MCVEAHPSQAYWSLFSLKSLDPDGNSVAKLSPNIAGLIFANIPFALLTSILFMQMFSRSKHISFSFLFHASPDDFIRHFFLVYIKFLRLPFAEYIANSNCEF